MAGEALAGAPADPAFSFWGVASLTVVSDDGATADESAVPPGNNICSPAGGWIARQISFGSVTSFVPIFALEIFTAGKILRLADDIVGNGRRYWLPCSSFTSASEIGAS